MATREPAVELFYDPAELDPHAPWLRVGKNGSGWELRDDDGALLSAHQSQSDAIDAALERSKARFSEILVRGSTGDAEWVVNQDTVMRELMDSLRKRGDGGGRRRIGVMSRYHYVFMPPRYRCRTRGAVGVRAVPAELFYDPAELDAGAPRLRIGKNAGAWELREDDGTVLGRHPSLPDAIDAGLERSARCFSEILVRDASGRQEWSVHHNPDWIELIRVLVRTAPARREAAA